MPANPQPATHSERNLHDESRAVKGANQPEAIRAPTKWARQGENTMVEITIYGRGGQGGVTLAKLIAQAYFLRGAHAQAFGVYAAERSGAPLQAFVRIDDEEITNHNQIQTPDHAIVLDRTLIGPNAAIHLKSDGWIILNAPEPPTAFQSLFPGQRVATVDATAIAVSHGLGTRTVPIVNTTMLGAIARVLERTIEDVNAALEALKFGGLNIVAAGEAFAQVVMEQLPGERNQQAPGKTGSRPVSLFDDNVGGMPAIRTGAWATRRPHRRRLTSPCNHACPAGNDTQGFVAAAGEQDYDRALAILLETSPFPGICGRVCPAPCMEACNRSLFDESVNIRELERYIADHGARRALVHRAWQDLHVAIVGSGPAGLSAAYHLARLGYMFTVFEAGDELGGVMRTGIPAYRLPRDVLDREIDFILDQGIEARKNHAVDRNELLRLSREYDAVLIATGLQESRSLDLGPTHGGSHERIMQGIDFLDRVRTGTASVNGNHILVIGGGNTAVDAARSARRLGAGDVRIIYRRTRDQMPAIAEEIDAALEEGIRINELVAPVRLQANSAGACLTCQRMKLGEPDESGRARPVPETSEDAHFDLRCDLVILALGQSPQHSILPEGTTVKQNGIPIGLTDAPVFCSGDFATNDGTVAAAIGSGRRIALNIHRQLTGEDLLPRPEPSVAGPEYVKNQFFEHSPRHDGNRIGTKLRRYTFAEVNRGLPEDADVSAAADEAQRCFSCGVCNECDQCVVYCPEGILTHDEEGFRFDYEYCKGCGVCATQCPRGVIYMAEL